MAFLQLIASWPGPVCLAVLAVVAFEVLRRDDGDVQEGPRADMYDSTGDRVRRSLQRRRT